MLCKTFPASTGGIWSASPTTARSIAKALEVNESKLFENCFEQQKPKAQVKRLKKPQLDHVPDDIFNALATTCKKPNWKWEVIRWIIAGYERDNSYHSMSQNSPTKR